MSNARENSIGCADSRNTINNDGISSIGIDACYNSWVGEYPQVTPFYTYYSSPVDKGLKALSIVKALMDKKLVKLATIKQFIDLMDELVKVL